MEYIDVKTAAKRTSLSKHSLYKLVKQGMPHYRVGKKILFKQDDIDSWFAQQFKSETSDNDMNLDHILMKAIENIDIDND